MRRCAGARAEHPRASSQLPGSFIKRTLYIAATAPGNGSSWRESIASMA